MMKNRKPTPEEKAEILRNLPWLVHQACTWEQVGPCVYCVDHAGVRLYNGQLPPERRTEAPCTEHDWDEDFGQGFYFLCRRCGHREWTE